MTTREPELADWPDHLRPYAAGIVRLNAGCGANQMPGWINADMNVLVRPDVRLDFEHGHLPFPSRMFDVVYASHVLEHVRNIHSLMAEFWRILANQGSLIIIVPYAGSDDAFEDPHHVRYFNENSWGYFDNRQYEAPGTHGTLATQGDPVRSWDIVGRWLIPYPEFREDPELDWKTKHLRNIIREMHVVLVKRGINGPKA